MVMLTSFQQLYRNIVKSQPKHVVVNEEFDRIEGSREIKIHFCGASRPKKTLEEIEKVAMDYLASLGVEPERYSLKGDYYSNDGELVIRINEEGSDATYRALSLISSIRNIYPETKIYCNMKEEKGPKSLI